MPIVTIICLGGNDRDGQREREGCDVFQWIKSFFASTDRVTVAGERIAKAAEDVADMMEQARDQFRARCGPGAAATTAATSATGCC